METLIVITSLIYTFCTITSVLQVMLYHGNEIEQKCIPIWLFINWIDGKYTHSYERTGLIILYFIVSPIFYVICLFIWLRRILKDKK